MIKTYLVFILLFGFKFNKAQDPPVNLLIGKWKVINYTKLDSSIVEPEGLLFITFKKNKEISLNPHYFFPGKYEITNAGEIKILGLKEILSGEASPYQFEHYFEDNQSKISSYAVKGDSLFLNGKWKISLTKAILSKNNSAKEAFSQKSTDISQEYTYEICIANKAKPSKILKNETKGIGDTTVAFVTGKVFEKKEPLAFAIITFTNSNGQSKGVISDEGGNYKITLDKGEYVVGFKCLGYSTISIDKLKLGTGQIQEINVDLGKASGFTTYEIKSKTPLTEKQLKRNREKLEKED